VAKLTPRVTKDEVPPTLPGVPEVLGSGKFNFLSNFLGLKAWPLSSPL